VERSFWATFRGACVFGRRPIETWAVADIDLLKSREELSRLFELNGGKWEEISALFNSATSWISEPPTRKTIGSVFTAITSVLRPIAVQSPEASYDGQTKGVVDELLQTGSDKWAEVK